MNEARIKQNGPRVLVGLSGKELDLPWEAAIELGRALMNVGRQAETYAKASDVISEQALLTRSGAPFGIVPANSKLMDEALKEAAWGSEARKAVPSIKSRSVVGTPGLIQHPPRGQGNG